MIARQFTPEREARDLLVFDQYWYYDKGIDWLVSEHKMSRSTVEHIVIGQRLEQPERCPMCRSMATRMAPDGRCMVCVVRDPNTRG